MYNAWYLKNDRLETITFIQYMRLCGKKMSSIKVHKENSTIKAARQTSQHETNNISFAEKLFQI